jgi:hypothetical protein
MSIVNVPVPFVFSCPLCFFPPLLSSVTAKLNAALVILSVASVTVKLPRDTLLTMAVLVSALLLASVPLSLPLALSLLVTWPLDVSVSPDENTTLLNAKLPLL